MSAVRQKALEVGPIMKNALGIAYENKVKIAFGTDAGVNDHGTNAYELVLMNEAGMSERDILILVTVDADDLLDLAVIAGTIEVGKDAGIIASQGNPLEDIALLPKPTFVMARGNEKYLDGPPIDLFPWSTFSSLATPAKGLNLGLVTLKMLDNRPHGGYILRVLWAAESLLLNSVHVVNTLHGR